MRRRGAERAVVTKRIMVLDQTDPKSTEELEALKMFLRDKQEILRSLNDKILEEIESAELQDVEEKISKEIEENSDLDEKIIRNICKIDGLLKPRTKVESVESENFGKTAKVKLPKITLKKFNGNTTEFLAFYEQFISSVHNNNELSDIDKFVYLKNLLSDKANGCLKGLALSKGNYSAALELIKTRFGNRQVIISNHMEKLTNLQKVSSSSNFKDLRMLYDNIESNIRSLESLGVESKQYGSLLVPVILGTLPDDIRLIVSRNCTSENDAWKLDDLLSQLEKEVLARERCNLVTPEEKLSTAHTLNVNETTGCIFCDGKHKSWSCRTISAPEERRNILYSKGRCFYVRIKSIRRDFANLRAVVVNAKGNTILAFTTPVALSEMELIPISKQRRKKEIYLFWKS